MNFESALVPSADLALPSSAMTGSLKDGVTCCGTKTRTWTSGRVMKITMLRLLSSVKVRKELNDGRSDTNFSNQAKVYDCTVSTAGTRALHSQ